MTKRSIFASRVPHPEPSSLSAFAMNDLDRRVEQREEDCLQKAFAVEGTHILAFSAGKLVLKHDGQVLDPLFAPYELPELEADLDSAVLLGYQETGEPRIAVPVNCPPEALASRFKPADARMLYREELIGEKLQGEVAQAISLLQWNADNRFCGRCGSAMEAKIGGYKRMCGNCGHTIFPRTDPVVIMLVVDEENDRCLLGRSHRFPEGMYSCLAGFLEPGETVENAVRRETHEESGITVGRVRYHASQPWPMPHSLMIGCFGEALSLDIVRDEAELADCRWFSREEVEDMAQRRPEERGLTAPAKGAIAYRLMRDWLDWQE